MTIFDWRQLRRDDNDGKPTTATLEKAVAAFNESKRLRETARELWKRREKLQGVERGKYAK